MDTREPLFRQPHWTINKVSVGLVLVTLLTYSPALWCDFVGWDDPIYVTRNPAVQAGLSPSGIAYAFTTFDSSNWIPLTWLSYELDSSLFGLQPVGFHATNVILHACNVCLLFLVLKRLTAATGRSAVVALFYAVHPLHVESVAWISERKDVLSTFWLMCALLLYEWYARQPSSGRLIATGLCMALGLLAKPMLVTLPILLLLLDLWPLRRIAWNGVLQPAVSPDRYPPCHWWQAILEKLPLFALSLIAGSITLMAQQVSMIDGSTIPTVTRLGNALQAYGWYLWKTVLPTGLCAFYPHPLHALSWPVVGFWACLLLAFSVLVVYSGRRRPYLLFGWLWFLMTLLPVLGLVQVGMQAYADRYAYVPHIGLFVMIVWGIHDLLAQFESGWKCGVLLVIAGSVVCVSLTRSQISTWQNTQTLWSHALTLDHTNYVALGSRGVMHFQEGNCDAAQRDFLEALDSNPNDHNSIYWLGRLCYEREAWDQAAQYFIWVLRIDPQHKEAAHYLDLVSSRMAPQSNPIQIGTAPAKPNPAAVDQVRIGLRHARNQNARNADFESALQHFDEAIRIDPAYAGAHVNAAIACRELGRWQDAIQHMQSAVAGEPNHPEHRINLAQLLELTGQLSEARSHYLAALKLKPTDVEAQIRLSRLLKHLRP